MDATLEQSEHEMEEADTDASTDPYHAPGEAVDKLVLNVARTSLEPKEQHHKEHWAQI
jgi:hypothetical protein